MNIEPSKWAYAASEEIAPSYNEFDVLAAAYTIDNLAIEPAIAQLRADLARVTAERDASRGNNKLLDNWANASALRARVAELEAALRPHIEELRMCGLANVGLPALETALGNSANKLASILARAESATPAKQEMAR